MEAAIRLRGCAMLLIFLLAVLIVGFTHKSIAKLMRMTTTTTTSHDGVAYQFAKVVSSTFSSASSASAATTNPSSTLFPSSSLNNNASTDHENAVTINISAARQSPNVGESIVPSPNATSDLLVVPNSPRSHFLSNRSIDSLRFAAFGSSKTWGNGLSHSERQVYVKLLSPTSRNFGIRGGQANYPSYCLHSMIGDEVFDVILLEFIPMPGEHHEHFERLVKRLRRRLPAAILIYLHMPMPLTDVLYHGQLLREYIASRNLTSPQEDPLQLEATIRNISAADLKWDTENVDWEAYYRTVRSAGGFVVVFPNLYETIQDTILENIQYFGKKNDPWDFVHPNALGHQHAADKIRRELEAFLSKYDDDNKPSVLPAVVSEATPDCEDACIHWLDDPQLAKDVPVFNMTMGFMQRRGAKKYFLQVDRAGGSLSVDCSKFSSSCHIYLLHAASGPSKMYPRVRVSLMNDDQVEQHQTLLVIPHIPQFHIITTAYVGTLVNTTWANVTVIPLPEDAYSSTHGFRIAGVLMTSFYTTFLEWI